MVLPKKIFKCLFCLNEILPAGSAVPLLTTIGKVCWLHFVLKVVKKFLGWYTILHELKGVVKAKIAQNNSQVSDGGITVQTRSRFHSRIDYSKSESVCHFCNLYLVTNCIQMIGEFLMASFKHTMRWKIFQWIEFLFRTFFKFMKT